MVSKITTLPPAGQGRGAGEGGSRDRRGQPAGRPLSEALPDVPTISEFVPGYEASGWFGIGAPKNTPTEIVDKLNNEINAGLADPNIKARLVDLGGTVLVLSPADFGKLIADDTEKWAKVIRAANIKPE
jgi:tripartite-type tricarboxylate transporter receptor subunit TctC